MEVLKEEIIDVLEVTLDRKLTAKEKRKTKKQLEYWLEELVIDHDSPRTFNFW